MQTLIDAIKTMDPTVFATEESACAAIVAIRFPDGICCPRCSSACVRTTAQVTCLRRRKPHRFTILTGTPFGTKLKPRIRAILMGLKEMLLGTGVFARALAREIDMPANTAWRHLHTLRMTLPMKVEQTRPPGNSPAPATLVESESPAWAHVGFAAKVEVTRVKAERAPTGTCVLYRNVGGAVSISLYDRMRVTAQWLHRYAQEISSRADYGEGERLQEAVARLLSGPSLIFRIVRLVLNRGR